MSMSEPNHESNRLAKIEELLTHLQHDVEQLNQALLGQQRQLDELQRSFATLGHRVQRMSPGEDGFDPVLEKPPHY
jgi:SlyX protein